MQCPKLMMCPAKADLSEWSRWICWWCFLTLMAIKWPICPWKPVHTHRGFCALQVSRVIFDQPKEAGGIPWQKTDRLDVPGWDPDDIYEGWPNVGQESDQVRIIADQSSLHSRIESSTNWPDTIAILLECDMEKLQFIMQAVLVTQSSGLIHQDGNYSLLIGR
jgi:hypothetical protein